MSPPPAAGSVGLDSRTRLEKRGSGRSSEDGTQGGGGGSARPAAEPVAGAPADSRYGPVRGACCDSPPRGRPSLALPPKVGSR